MVNQIEMSLDDIIRSTPSLKEQRGGGAPRRGGSGNGNPQVRRGGRPVHVARDAQRRGNSGGSGYILKGHNRGGIQKSKFPKGDMNRTWEHDLYDVGKLIRGAIGTTATTGEVGGSTKLTVSNLDYGVSEEDILELFADFGQVKSVSVHFDRSGRSLGTADVIFERKADALKAVNQYNGVSLDGRPMNIQLAISEVPSAGIKSRLGSVAVRPQSSVGNVPRGSTGKFFVNAGGNRREGAPRNGGSSGRPLKTKAPKPTAEELDAELDAYVKENEANIKAQEAKSEAKSG